MLEFFAQIVIGQLFILLLIIVRKARSFFQRTVLEVAFWYLLMAMSFVWTYEFSWIPLMFGPVLMIIINRAAFNQPVSNRVYLRFIPAVFLTFIGWYFPYLCRILVMTYFIIEFLLLFTDLIRFKTLKGISMPNSPIRFKWLLFFQIFSSIIIICGYIAFWWGIEIFNYVFVFTLVFLTVGTSWFFIQPENFGPITSTKKYAGSSLDSVEKYRIVRGLEDFLSGDYFLRPDASLSDLAKKIHTTPQALSQVINEKKYTSFFDMLATQRVNAAKNILRNREFDDLTIEQVGERVGYMAKSSFNTVFKKKTGKTPSEFRSKNVRDHHVERLPVAKTTDSGVYASMFELLNNSSMNPHFFRIYIRRLIRNRSFSLLNFLGLIIGMVSSILILLYVFEEFSYDQFHKDASRIHRIAFFNNNPQTRTPHPMAQALVKNFPEVEEAVSLTPLYGPGLSKQSIYLHNPDQDILYQEPDGYAADSTFFRVFDFRLIIGNEEEALKKTGGLIISQSLAKKYFGDENPLGKILELGSDRNAVVVSGVMEDVPENSHFHPNFIISYVTLKYMDPDDPWFSWEDFGHFNYVKLTDPDVSESIEDDIPVWLHQNGHISDEDLASHHNDEWRFELQPLTDIHLHSNIRWELEANGNIVYIYILAAAILFILLITGINFINLSTARVIERSNEIGIKRSLGANKWMLSANFLLESILSGLIALIFAIIACFLLLPQYNALTQKRFTIGDLTGWEIMIPAFVVTMVIGILSGVVPSVLAMGIKVTEILKGKVSKNLSATGFRKALVAVQFGVSSVLIFGSIVLFMQVKYLQNRPLGYEDEIVVIKLNSNEAVKRIEALKSEVLKIQGVSSVGAVSNLPGGQFNQNALYSLQNPDQFVDVSQLLGDFQLMEPLGLELVEGQWFERGAGKDSLQSFVLNETAVRQLGMKDPVGEKVYWDDDNQFGNGRIIGVVKDFHFQSLHVPIQPLIITVNHDELSYLLVKLGSQNTNTTLKEIARIYGQFDNEFGYDGFFLDQKNQQLYEAEVRSLQIFNLFALIAVALSAVGLLGLAYLIIIQRTKEIGIRKILGASVPELLWKENLAFIRLIALGMVIGLPVAFLLMNEWLAEFAYRTGIGIEVFLITTAIMLVIAIASVSIAIMRTVFINPSRALRYE